jgi:hypothetical protein
MDRDSVARDGPVYKARTFHYPDGGVETVAWINRARPDPSMLPLRHKSPEEKAADALRNVERATRRAKTRMRRHARALGLDRMLTLTTRESSNTYAQVCEDFDRFRRLIRKLYPELAYVAVPELHPEALVEGREHWHIHLGVRGFMDVRKLRECWHQVLRRRIHCEGAPGNVRVDKKHGDPARIARYLAKYLGKSLDVGRVAHRKGYWVAGPKDALKLTEWNPVAGTWTELVLELAADDCVWGVRTFEPTPGVLWLEGWVSGRVPEGGG